MTVEIFAPEPLGQVSLGWVEPSGRGGLSLSTAVTQEQSKHFGKSWKGWVAKVANAIRHTVQIWPGCVRPKTHKPLTATSFTPTLCPWSGETQPKSCCHLLRTCCLSFLQDTSWQNSLNYFLFLLLGQKVLQPGMVMGSSFEEANLLNDELVQRVPRASEIQGLAESQELRTDLPQCSSISNAAKVGWCTALGLLSPWLSHNLYVFIAVYYFLFHSEMHNQADPHIPTDPVGWCHFGWRLRSWSSLSHWTTLPSGGNHFIPRRTFLSSFPSTKECVPPAQQGSSFRQEYLRSVEYVQVKEKKDLRQRTEEKSRDVNLALAEH